MKKRQSLDPTHDMMHLNTCLQQFSQNTVAFAALLSGTPETEWHWRPAPEKWCLLEILCHLADEERDDFRARVRHVLETPDLHMLPIDPVGWVTDRNYWSRDFEEALNDFLRERKMSAQWLLSLPPMSEPVWENAYLHPKLGPMGAKMLLANWLAHDLLHIRQIVRLKHERLQNLSGETLTYAGNW
ncbi:MAG: DinB family protein [Saprospiraceae bacterium]